MLSEAELSSTALCNNVGLTIQTGSCKVETPASPACLAAMPCWQDPTPALLVTHLLQLAPKDPETPHGEHPGCPPGMMVTDLGGSVVASQTGVSMPCTSYLTIDIIHTKPRANFEVCMSLASNYGDCTAQAVSAEYTLDGGRLIGMCPEVCHRTPSRPVPCPHHCGSRPAAPIKGLH